ncbi:hypothetical protein [Streptomyces lanatus]|uniref:Lipoprotein n=1 Tax=Streptomyces lanatus TaxID=66900 RepID=A0ABV1XUN4_9ACTN|nr:hypothetical protein [Streptomyces lanatus]GHH13623.1 hypothetical protein GCM10018780_53770 [Streptomyces lanatus]
MPGAREATATPGRLSAAFTLCLTAVLSGCTERSGGGGSSELGLKAGMEASPGGTAATGLGELALASTDVAGFSVTAPDAEVTIRQGDVRPSDAACAPVAYALAGTAVGKPSGTQVRQAAGRRP